MEAVRVFPGKLGVRMAAGSGNKKGAATPLLFKLVYSSNARLRLPSRPQKLRPRTPPPCNALLLTTKRLHLPLLAPNHPD